MLFDGYLTMDSDAESVCALILQELERKGFEVEKIVLRDKKIAACQGCFNCWFITPGECKIADYGREIAKKMVNSNLIIHLTPITFGGYSSELKKVLDRFIPKIKPYFTRRNGEIHHRYRYKNYASIIAVGVLDKPDEEKESIFKELIQRNSLNIGAPVHEAIIYTKDQSKTGFTSEFIEILEKVEEKA